MPYGKEALALTRHKFAFLQGGRAYNYMDVEPFGADGYLSVYSRVYPDLSNRWWNAYHSGDIKTAVELVGRYDCEFFDLADNNGMHFSAAIQGLYEIAGLGSRWRRPPYSSLTDAQMEILRQFLAERGLA